MNGLALKDPDDKKSLEAAALALQFQLSCRTEKARETEDAARAANLKMRAMQQEAEDMRRETQDITRDMTRQYKSMQEDLTLKITALEHALLNLKDELEATKSQHSRVLREKDLALDKKDGEIAAMKSRMEDMAMEFGDMLKETLEKMKERIELNSGGWDEKEEKGAGVPVQRKIEEFNLKAEAK